MLFYIPGVIRCLERRIGKMVSSWFCNTMKIYQPPISAKLSESAKTVVLQWFCEFFWQRARRLVKNFKMLINTGESGIVYCMECWKYVGLTLTWDVLKLVCSCIHRVHNLWLTLTWDVLKLLLPYNPAQRYTINFNMGCIETALNSSEKLSTLID